MKFDQIKLTVRDLLHDVVIWYRPQVERKCPEDSGGTCRVAKQRVVRGGTKIIEWKIQQAQLPQCQNFFHKP